jgi:hypothetical protein
MVIDIRVVAEVENVGVGIEVEKDAGKVMEAEADSLVDGGGVALNVEADSLVDGGGKSLDVEADSLVEGVGKALIDLGVESEEDVAGDGELVRDCDVFRQSRRPTSGVEFYSVITLATFLPGLPQLI